MNENEMHRMRRLQIAIRELMEEHRVKVLNAEHITPESHPNDKWGEGAIDGINLKAVFYAL